MQPIRPSRPRPGTEPAEFSEPAHAEQSEEYSVRTIEGRKGSYPTHGVLKVAQVHFSPRHRTGQSAPECEKGLICWRTPRKPWHRRRVDRSAYQSIIEPSNEITSLKYEQTRGPQQLSSDKPPIADRDNFKRLGGAVSGEETHKYRSIGEPFAPYSFNNVRRHPIARIAKLHLRAGWKR
jgi:hypothetical protein